MNYQASLAKRLRAARITEGYGSAKIFAQKNNTPYSTYFQHESGEVKMNADTLVQYANVLGINPTWLLLGSGLPYFKRDTTKETILNKELMQLGIKQEIHYLDPISFEANSDNVLLIDIALFVNILMALLNKTNDENQTQELINFAIELYNDISTTSADDTAKNNLIRFASDSFSSKIKSHD